MKLISLLLIYVSLLLFVIKGEPTRKNPQNNKENEPITEEEFCEALRAAITSLNQYENDDADLIQEYCDYIRNMDKLKLKTYKEHSDYDKLVKKYKRYKKNKRAFKNKKARKSKGFDGKEFIEQYGITKFSDLTEDEWLQMFPKGDDGNNEARRLYGYISTNCAKRDGNTMFLTTQANGYQINLSQYCPNVKDQGWTSLCWAFAASSMFECEYEFFSGGIQKTFSPNQVADCTGSESGTKGGGGWVYKVLYFGGQLKGFCSDYAYDHDLLDATDYNNFCDCREPLISGTCYQVEFTGTEDQVWDHMVRVVQSGHAFQIAFYVDTEFSQVSGNVFDGQCNQEYEKGLHYMTVIGQYDGDYLLIKNSWGTDWGDGGLMYITKGAYMRCSKKYGEYSNRFGVLWYSYNFQQGGYSALQSDTVHNYDDNINDFIRDGNTDNINTFGGFKFTDIMIMALVIGNFIIMVYVYCYKTKVSAHTKHGYMIPEQECDVDV